MTNNERRAVYNTVSGKPVFRGALEFAHNHQFYEKKVEKVPCTKIPHVSCE
jgi:hypothetical protein